MEEELKVKQIDKPMHFGHQAVNVDQLNPTFYEFAFILLFSFISNVLYWFFRNILFIYYTFIAFKKGFKFLVVVVPHIFHLFSSYNNYSLIGQKVTLQQTLFH